MDSRKIYCEVIEGIVYDDRCLFKLSKVIEDNKMCESCILRELEKIKSPKTKASDMSSMSSDIKRSKGIKGRSKKGSKLIGNGHNKQMYNSKELSELLGKAERTLQEWAQKGKIPAVRVGIKWRFPKEEIDRWLSKRKDDTPGIQQPEEGEELPEFQKPDFIHGNQGETEKEA